MIYLKRGQTIYNPNSVIYAAMMSVTPAIKIMI